MVGGEERKRKEEHAGSCRRRKKWRTSVVRSRGGTRLFISEKGCKDCSRAVSTLSPSTTRCSRQTRGRITAVIIRLMPCKLSGRERPFAWLYAHFIAPMPDPCRRAAIIAIIRPRQSHGGFDKICQSSFSPWLRQHTSKAIDRLSRSIENSKTLQANVIIVSFNYCTSRSTICGLFMRIYM